ncbi:MAG: ASKHA domain-containing protein [Dehalobacterium sp.]
MDYVDSVTLAGAFGSYIDKESALVIGMFPDCPLDKVAAVGNAAGDCAKLALFDKDKRREAQEVANFVQFVETAVEPDFQTQFAMPCISPMPRTRSLISSTSWMQFQKQINKYISRGG